MRQHLVFAFAALAGIVPGAAAAADFLSTEVTTFTQPARVAEWAQFYIGIQGGGAMSNRNGCYEIFAVTVDCASPAATPFDYNQQGFLLGAQAGANFFITDQFVVGAEVDAAMTNITGELLPGDIDGGVGTYTSLATGTVKVGYAFDQAMIYAEAGVAIANFRYEGNAGCDFDQTHTGAVVGVGASYRVAENISIFGEYNHVWLPSNSITCGTFMVIPTAVVNQGSLHIGKVGLNYEF